jgi:hypothetical protein
MSSSRRRPHRHQSPVVIEGFAAEAHRVSEIRALVESFVGFFDVGAARRSGCVAATDCWSFQIAHQLCAVRPECVVLMTPA